MRQTLYVIVNMNDTNLYWSVGDGWVDYLHCDTFSSKDKMVYSLPVNGEWEDFMIITS